MPNTDAYLGLGLAVTLSVLATFTISLTIRFYNARKMIGLLEALSEDEA